MSTFFYLFLLTKLGPLKNVFIKMLLFTMNLCVSNGTSCEVLNDDPNSCAQDKGQLLMEHSGDPCKDKGYKSYNPVRVFLLKTDSFYFL
jgi:hypothetical protein